MYVNVSRTEEIHAALFESQGLFVENIADFVGLRVARLDADAQGTDRSGDEHLVRGGFARFARDLDAAADSAAALFAKPERRQLEAVRAEGVGLDDLRASLNIGLVHAEHRFRLGNIQLIEAALRFHRIVQHRAHGAIGDEHRVFQAFIEI